MNRLPYILFILVFIIEFLATKLHLIPKVFKYSPELFSAVTIVLVVFRVGYVKTLALSPKYVILFALFVFHIIAGIILNGVPEGAIFAGFRYYFKFIPIFLLPVVYNFTDNQISTQLKVLVILGITQIPVSFYQRLFQFKGQATGDNVTGTLLIGSVQSIFLISCVCILVAFYLKKRVSGKHIMFLALALFLPATINETKGTVILLPFGLFTVLLILATTQEARKRIFGAMIAAVMLLSVFVVAYDFLYQSEDRSGGASLIGFFSGDFLEHYLYRGAEFDQALLNIRENNDRILVMPEAEKEHEARIDRFLAPLIMLSEHDPMKLLFGLGAGNVALFNFKGFIGDYAHISVLLGAEATLLALLLWEVGIIGVILYLIFFYMIFSDARSLSKSDSLAGAIAAGWAGVVVILVVALPYKNTLGFNVLGFLFWYFSGYIVAKRIWLQREQRVMGHDT